MRDLKGNLINLTESVCHLGPQETTGTTTTKPNANKGVFRIPIKRRDGGIPVVEVSFNGQKFEMLLDTGASLTKVTEEMALLLGLKPDRKLQTQVASGDIVEFDSAIVDSIDVGGAILKNVRVTIGSVPLLGQNVFGKYDVSIKEKEVEFRVRKST